MTKAVDYRSRGRTRVRNCSSSQTPPSEDKLTQAPCTIPSSFGDSPTSTDISVIIPVCDDLVGLHITLESLLTKATPNVDVEVIVCNDGGSPEVSALASEFGVKEVKLPINVGAYGARNAGIRASTGRVLAFLDADERVDPAWLTRGLEISADTPYVGGQIIVDLPPEPTVAQRFDASFAFNLVRSLHDGYFPTANLFVRREVFSAIGLFNERLRSSGDVEFGQRVRAGGFEQAYCADAITHHPPRSFRQQLDRNRRISSGLAYLKTKINGEPVATLLADSLCRLAAMPVEIGWRVIAPLILPRYRSDQLILTLYSKIIKAHWLACFSENLIRIALGRHRSYQDPPVSSR